MSDEINTGISSQAYNDYVLMCKSKGIAPTPRAKLEGGSGSEANKDEEEEVARKECKRCHVEKELDEFYINRQCRDGHENVCKACKKEKARKSDPKRPAQQVIDDPIVETAPAAHVQYMSVAQAKVFVRQAYALGVEQGKSQIEVADVTLDELLEVGGE